MQTPVIIMGASGRMGSTLTRLAREGEGISLAGVVEREDRQEGLEHLGCPVEADLDRLLPQCPGAAIIDFTAPEVSLGTARTAARFGNPVVVGTTGLNKEQVAQLTVLAEKNPVFWAPNMSIGVNALCKVLPLLTEILGAAYDLEISEIHHRHKKDAPSGTALKLAQVLAEARGWDLDKVAAYCREGIIGARPDEEIGVQTLRGGDVVGDHTAYFFGPGERIEVTHRAHSRDTFASGALRAAAWLSGQKPGRLYAMADMFA